MLFALVLLAALATPVPAPTAAPAVAPAAGTYVFKATLAGAAIGTSTIVVKPVSTGTEIDEDSSGSLDGMQMTGQVSMRVDDTLAPTSYAGRYVTGPRTTSATATFTTTLATVANSAAGKPQTIGLTGTAQHFVALDPGLMAGMFALPAQMHAWNDAIAIAVSPVYAQGQAIVPNTSAAPTHPKDVPAADVAVSFAGALPFTIWYDPTTFVPDEVSVPSQSVVVTRVRP